MDKKLTYGDVHKLCISTAAKSPCKKRKVGAVIVAYKGARPVSEIDYFEVMSVGYNHPADGSDICEIDNITLDIVIHAEAHAIANLQSVLTPNKSNTFEITHTMVMFVTHEPCNGCKAALEAAGLLYHVVGEFMKFDQGKARMNLVPASLAQGAARALTYGAKKYKVNNWRNTKDIERYINALQRHIDAWREGEENDPESGLSHLDHMAANLCFITELKHLPKISEE